MTAEVERAKKLLESGQAGLATIILQGVLRGSPKDADALIVCGEVAAAQDDLEDAARWLRKAANAEPSSPAVQHEVGAALLKLGRIEDALRRFEAAARLDSTISPPLVQMGQVYLERLEQPAAAVAAFREALAHRADDFALQHDLGKALFELGQIDHAIAEFYRAHELASATGRNDAADLCLKHIAIAIPGSPQATNAEILDARRKWAQTIEPAETSATKFQQRNRTADRPLTIGYVSSYFSRENWMKPVWALLNAHDRDACQVRLFSFGPVPGGEDPGSAKDSAWRPHETDRVFEVSQMSNEGVARLIEKEEVDVLVDLNGYSAVNRLPLFALRPAPLIVGWFNMYATTGMRSYDYLIGDRHVVLPEEEPFYVERIARVPGSYLTFDVGYRVPDVAEPPHSNNGLVTFGSLASRYKITPEVVDAWGQILQRCPASRLLLRNAAMGAASERDFLARQFEQHGIERARLDLRGRAPHYEFLETYAEMDLALDTFPYNGGTTTTEAIWQGVPVIAFAGSTWASRTSATILREGGLGEWVANDLPGYVELAVKAGVSSESRDQLASLRRSMREHLRRSSVCDVKSFARAMEGLYREMWQSCKT